MFLLCDKFERQESQWALMKNLWTNNNIENKALFDLQEYEIICLQLFVKTICKIFESL